MQLCAWSPILTDQVRRTVAESDRQDKALAGAADYLLISAVAPRDGESRWGSIRRVQCRSNTLTQHVYVPDNTWR